MNNRIPSFEAVCPPSRRLVLILLLALGLGLHPAGAEPRAVNTSTSPDTTYPNWMRWIPDSTPLSILSIPGTHDSMSFYGGPVAKTQSMPLPEQLRAGIRTIDIRARHVSDRLAIYHGPIFQNATFGDVLNACNSFLAQNPSETIVLWLSDAGVPGELNVTRSYGDTFRWYRDESGLGQRIYTPSALAHFDLPLGQVRGKIVMIADDCYECGWPGFGVEQNHSGEVPTAFDMPDKWAAIVVQAVSIDAGLTNRMYENSLSGSSGGVYPIDLANGLLGYEGMNYRYLKYLFTGNQRRTTGLLYMDFPGSGLIAAVLAHNMKYAANLTAMAPDFEKVVRDLSYGITHDGVFPATEHVVQLKMFLRHILPAQQWSVLASAGAGSDSWGYAVEPDGIMAQTPTINSYTHVAIGNRPPAFPLSASKELNDFWTAGLLTPLSGSATVRASGAQALLKARFPNYRWNVAVRRVPYDPSSWAVDLETELAAGVPVADDGTLFFYTAWATSSTNRPPTASPGGPYAVDEGTPVTFDAGQSSDPTGDVLQFRWDINGDGTWDTDYSHEPTATFTFLDNPAPVVWLEVFDGASRTIEKVSLAVRNVTPTVAAPGYIVLGEDRTLNKSLTIVDPGADTWTVRIAYGDGSSAVTPVLVGRTFTLNHQFPSVGYFPVTVELSDDDGDHSLTRINVVTGAPVLDIQRLDSTMVRITWPDHPAPFRLESAPQLPGSNWESVPGTIAINGGRKANVIESVGSRQFFRLALP